MSASQGEGARIVWPTAVTAVEPDLLYRGYRVEELAERASFLETAYLLVAGELPISEQWADWQALMLGGMTLSDNIAGWLTRVPAAATPLDVLSGAFTRTRLSEGPPPPATTQDIRDGLPQWLGFVTAVVAGRIRWTRGLAPLAPRDDLSFAGNLWWLIHGREPAAHIERALDMLLVLGADHGLAPATIAVRLAAAAGADFPAALQAGTSLAMSRHPVGVAEASLDLLHEVKTPARAKAWVEQRLEQHAGLPGFEHRIYRVGDPRTDVTAALCKRVAERAGRKEREELATAIEQAVWERQQRLPSVIWPAARLLDYLGVDRPLFGPLYVIARMAGWAAHYVEQRETSGWPQTASPYQGPGPRHYQPEHERA